MNSAFIFCFNRCDGGTEGECHLKYCGKGIFNSSCFVAGRLFPLPDYQFNSMSLEQRKTMEREDPAGWGIGKKNPSKLSWLQGGMRLVGSGRKRIIE